MFQNETRPNVEPITLYQSETVPIVVTGGAGFIGSHLVDALLGWFPHSPITVIDAFTYAAHPDNLTEAYQSGRLDVIHGSVEDERLMMEAIPESALVFHLASESHVPRSFEDPDLFDRVNRAGSASVFSAALARRARRVVYFSTAEVYGPRRGAAVETDPLAPVTPYAISKTNAEFEARRSRKEGLDIQILRPNNIIGTRQHGEKLLPTFVRQALSGQPLSIEGQGTQFRSFLSIEDVMAATRLLLERGQSNETYNLPGSCTLSVLALAALVTDVLNVPLRLRHVANRPFNDLTPQIDGEKLFSLGFSSNADLRQTIREIAAEIAQRLLQETPPLAPEIETLTKGITAAAFATKREGA